MTAYNKIVGPDNTIIVRENEDGSTSYIPADPANSDYQAYLAWLAEGNEAEQETN
jgi:hypothetical protein